MENEAFWFALDKHLFDVMDVTMIKFYEDYSVVYNKKYQSDLQLL